MIEEAITKIQEMAGQALVPNEVVIDGRTYYDKELHAVQPPLAHTEEVGTLTGFSDLVKANINQEGSEPEKNYIHVVGPGIVTLSRLFCNEWGRRQIDISCKLPNFGRFVFGEYLEQERFIVGLQSFFDQTPEDMAYLYKLAGTLQAEQVQVGSDDGLSQRVATRSGIVLAENTQVKRLVTLKPWRTFREIAQPSSTFIFRLKTVKDEIPMLALYVGDGEKWQLEAVQSIKQWLVAQHPEMTIVA